MPTWQGGVWSRDPDGVVPSIAPMLAGRGIPPDGLDRYAVEPKLDGWRVTVAVERGGLRVRTRNGRDITAQVPELAPLAELGVELLLDGELIAGAGRASDFYRVGPALATRRGPRAPLCFAAFDLLWFDGDGLTNIDYAKRRLQLEELNLSGAAIVVPSWEWTNAATLLRACAEQGIEGIVLKRRDSSYLPGRRTDAWRKIKCDRWYAEHAEYRRPRG